jgi:outer membrane biosynthesis protein TonB
MYLWLRASAVVLVAVGMTFLALPANAQQAPPTCIAQNLHPIMETHKIPPFPPSAVQMDETGTTLVRVVVGKDGLPVVTSTVDTSGFADLDGAATDWIKKTWRWQPLAPECPSIETRVSLKWNVIDMGRTYSAALQLNGPPGQYPSDVGTTYYDVLLSGTGDIMKLRVVTTSGYRNLDDKGADLVRGHKFVPAQVDGKPVASAFLIQMIWNPSHWISP